MSLALRTIALVAVLVAGGFAAGGCAPPPRCPPGASCPSAGPRVKFTATVNGQPDSPAANGSPAGFRVRPGERMLIRVTVTVPRRLTVTALWFGISTGALGGGPNGTGSMHPVLAHYRQQLPPGTNAFRLRWHIPGSGAGTSLYLVAAWSSRHPPGTVAQFVARIADS